MRSMTGFGLGEARLREGRVVVSVRSLNHRYLDVHVRVPPELSEFAHAVEQEARHQLTRGRYDVNVHLEGSALPPPRLSLERARTLYADLSRLRDELSPGSPLDIGVLAQLAGLVTCPADAPSSESLASVTEALNSALVHLAKMREDEGATLARELLHRLALTEAHVAALRQQAGTAHAELQGKIRQRLFRAVEDHALTPDLGRIETELALIGERLDVTEELVRLASHFDQLRALIALSEPTGRRLDFLLQEVGREVNTVGAKSQDTTTSHRIVELKAEVERLREQVQNVE